MKNVVHIIPRILDGGTEQGILTLVKNGFYAGTNFHLIELAQGHGVIRERMIHELGSDRFISMSSESKNIFDKMSSVPKLLIKMNSIFRRLKPETAITSLVTAHIVGRTVAMINPDIKIVSFEHLSAPRFKSALPLYLTSWRSDAIFSDTATTLLQREQHYMGRRSGYVVPLFVSEPQLPRQAVKPERIKILSLGRLHAQKNYAELIKAVATLLQEGHNIELTIAGDGPQRQTLKQLITNLAHYHPDFPIVERIHMPGFIASENTLQELRAAAHIYVQPSLYEGLCISTAEALAAGLPTAATLFAGARDYGTEENMRIIDGLLSDDIAQTLRVMITDYEKIVAPMSEAAINTAEQFSLEQVRPQWERSRQEIISPRHKRSSRTFSAAPSSPPSHP